MGFHCNSLALTLSLTAGVLACGGPVEDAAVAEHEAAARTRRKRTSPRVVAAPARLPRCSTLTHDTFYFTDADVAPLSGVIDTTLDVDSFDISVDSGAAACGPQPAETGPGYRLIGSLSLTDEIVLDQSTVGLGLVPGTGNVPYFLRLTVDVGDVSFASDGEMDISAYCTNLDQPVSGTISGVQLTVDLAPPRPGQNHFSVHDTQLTFDSIDVGFVITDPTRAALIAALAWLLPPCNLAPPPFNVACGNDAIDEIEGLIVSYVNTRIESTVGAEIAGFVNDALDGDPMVDSAVSAIDNWFWLLGRLRAPRIRTKPVDDVQICETRYASWAACNGGACARYRVR